MASVAFGNFNRLVIFFLSKHFGFPGRFFFFLWGGGGWGGSFGSFIVVVPSTVEPQ